MNFIRSKRLNVSMGKLVKMGFDLIKRPYTQVVSSQMAFVNNIWKKVLKKHGQITENIYYLLLIHLSIYLKKPFDKSLVCLYHWFYFSVKTYCCFQQMILLKHLLLMSLWNSSIYCVIS